MEEKILWDLYCFQCSLQFEKKSIYDMHLSIMHDYRKRTEPILTEIKSEPEEIELPIESNDIPTNPTEEQYLNTNSLKQKSVHFSCENGNICSSFLPKSAIFFAEHFLDWQEISDNCRRSVLQSFPKFFKM